MSALATTLCCLLWLASVGVHGESALARLRACARVPNETRARRGAGDEVVERCGDLCEPIVKGAVCVKCGDICALSNASVCSETKLGLQFFQYQCARVRRERGGVRRRCASLLP